MLAGLALLVIGNWYQAALPTSAVWTDEQAREYSRASAELHSASYGAGHSHDHGHDHSHDAGDIQKSADYLAAKAAFDKSKGALDRARSRQVWIKYGLIALGVVIATCGIIPIALDKLKEGSQANGSRKPRKETKSEKYFHP